MRVERTVVRNGHNAKWLEPEDGAGLQWGEGGGGLEVVDASGVHMTQEVLRHPSPAVGDEATTQVVDGTQEALQGEKSKAQAHTMVNLGERRSGRMPCTIWCLLDS